MKRWTITIHAETQAKAEEAVQEASVYIGDELFAEPEAPEYVEIQRDGHYRIRIEPPRETPEPSNLTEALSGQRHH